MDLRAGFGTQLLVGARGEVCDKLHHPSRS